MGNATALGRSEDNRGGAEIVLECSQYAEEAPLLVSDDKEINTEMVLDRSPGKRYPHLDIARFVAICVVIVDHGNWQYSYYNSMFGQNWVLQYVFVICGLCSSLSKSNLASTLFWLMMYVVVGVTLNWLAWIIKGLDWQRDFWNVIFQFFFVIALICYTVLLAPVKHYLQHYRAGHKSVSTKTSASPALQALNLVMFLSGLLAIFSLFSLCSGHWAKGALKSTVSAFVSVMGGGLAFWMGDDPGLFLMTVCSAIELTLSNLWIALMVPFLFPEQKAITGWLLIANMHIRRLFSWYSGVGEKVLNGFDLMLLGLVCAELGLKWRLRVGTYLARYWWMWLCICMLVWKPGTEGRMDLLQALDLPMVLRMRFIDTVFIVVFLTAGERFIDTRIFTEDRCYFISYLGLFLFLVHKAIHILLPVPFNWCLLIAIICSGFSIPLFS